MTAITARHVVFFKTTNAIPDNGDIQIIFPVGNTSNPNYASPNGFSFNGLADTDLSASFSPSGPSCDNWTITPSSGLVQCNLGTGPTGPTTITINIGISRTNPPVLVNPTKDPDTNIGTADRWTVNLKTRDDNNLELDSSKVSIATIESVQVYATVEPYITFTIAGVADSVAVNTDNSGCGSTEPTNTGIGSTATVVNLGVLLDTKVSLAAQLLTVTTNGNYGYSLTATSSGHLISPSIGYWIADAQGTPTNDNTPVPLTITHGSPKFGIRPCGQDAYYTSTPGDVWASDPCSADGGCKFANPSATYYYTLASDSTGPIGSGSGDGANDGLTTVEYAASISTIVPAGNYRTTITYVATATF